jgi:hypothetical protein
VNSLDERTRKELHTMKIRTIAIAAALGLGPAAWLAPQAMAQPEWDVVHVNLPYSIDVGKKVLPAGEYTIQQLHSDNSPILLFYNGKGVKFETSAMTIKALDLNTPEKTSVVLHRIGDDYYIDKIWIQGKDYGYEIPLPSRVKAREKEMSAVSVPAESSTTTTATEPTTTTTTDTTTSDTSTTTSDVANNNTNSNTNANNTNTSDTNTAATVPPPVTETTPVTTTNNTAQATDTTVTTDQQQSMSDDSANREKKPNTDETPAMPATSAGWLAMLLSGGSLSGAGLLLRRKR